MKVGAKNLLRAGDDASKNVEECMQWGWPPRKDLKCVFGAESAIRPHSLQRAGASGLLHQLLVRLENDGETWMTRHWVTSERDGEGTNLTLSNDIKDRTRLRVGTTTTFTQTQLDLEPRSAQCHVLTRKSVLCTLQEVYSVYNLRRQMAAAAGKKQNGFSVLVHGSVWP